MAEFIYLKIQAKMIQSFLRIRLLENLWFFYIYKQKCGNLDDPNQSLN